MTWARRKHAFLDGIEFVLQGFKERLHFLVAKDAVISHSISTMGTTDANDLPVLQPITVT